MHVRTRSGPTFFPRARGAGISSASRRWFTLISTTPSRADPRVHVLERLKIGRRTMGEFEHEMMARKLLRKEISAVHAFLNRLVTCNCRNRNALLSRRRTASSTRLMASARGGIGGIAGNIGLVDLPRRNSVAHLAASASAMARVTLHS